MNKYCSFQFHAAIFESFGVVWEGLVFNLKVGRYILCDRILRTQRTTLSLPERAEFTTQQMLSNKLEKWHFNTSRCYRVINCQWSRNPPSPGEVGFTLDSRGQQKNGNRNLWFRKAPSCFMHSIWSQYPSLRIFCDWSNFDRLSPLLQRNVLAPLQTAARSCNLRWYFLFRLDYSHRALESRVVLFTRSHQIRHIWLFV